MSVSEMRTARANLDKMLSSKASGVGQLNPYPTIEVLFKTLARTAIQKGDRGILYIILKDTTNVNKYVTIKSPSEILESEWDLKNAQLLQTAFEVFTPFRVVVRVQGQAEEINAVLAELETRKVTHLAVPGADSAEDLKIVTWIKSRIKLQGVVYVSAHATNSDSCAVVELQNKAVTHKLYTLSAQELTVMLAGAMAGCPLNRSLDNVVIPNLTLVDDVEPTKGKFALYNDDEQVRVRLAVNSKTTYDSEWKPDTRFIKIFEGMNIVKYDIQDTFKNYWLGLYPNTYENKMAFCNLVSKVYFAELTPNVLSPDFNNRIFIDEEANKRFIITDGLDPDTMSEMAIKRYPTSSQVFLQGEVRFTNTMVDLLLEITM